MFDISDQQHSGGLYQRRCSKPQGDSDVPSITRRGVSTMTGIQSAAGPTGSASFSLAVIIISLFIEPITTSHISHWTALSSPKSTSELQNCGHHWLPRLLWAVTLFTVPCGTGDQSWHQAAYWRVSQWISCLSSFAFLVSSFSRSRPHCYVHVVCVCVYLILLPWREIRSRACFKYRSRACCNPRASISDLANRRTTYKKQAQKRKRGKTTEPCEVRSHWEDGRRREKRRRKTIQSSLLLLLSDTKLYQHETGV